MTKKEMKEIKNIVFSKGGTGSITYKVNLPTKWVEDMNILENDRQVEMNYNKDEKSIKIIKKK